MINIIRVEFSKKKNRVETFLPTSSSTSNRRNLSSSASEKAYRSAHLLHHAPDNKVAVTAITVAARGSGGGDRVGMTSDDAAVQEVSSIHAASEPTVAMIPNVAEIVPDSGGRV